MKYLPLVWAGIWRKRGRAILMLLQIMSAFVLFGMLQGIDSGIQAVIARAHGDRLYVMSKVSQNDTLPIGMMTRIRSTPGVQQVSPIANFGGTWKNPADFIPVNAVDPGAYFRINDELQCSPTGAISALTQHRTGAIAGDRTLAKYGWKVGQHIVLKTGIPKDDGSSDWGFDIVGTCANPAQPVDLLTISFDYLNESRTTGRDRASAYVLKVSDESRAGTISLAIDNAFANSSNETRTRSEADLFRGNLEQLGNLGFITQGVIGAVFFAALFATSALMMQSLRERVPELAALKAIGFSDRKIMTLVLAESATFCVLAAVIGLAIAGTLMPLAGALGVSRVPGIVFVYGAGLALILAVVGAAVPALRAARLPVAAALAGR